MSTVLYLIMGLFSYVPTPAHICNNWLWVLMWGALMCYIMYAISSFQKSIVFFRNLQMNGSFGGINQRTH